MKEFILTMIAVAMMFGVIACVIGLVSDHQRQSRFYRFVVLPGTLLVMFVSFGGAMILYFTENADPSLIQTPLPGISPVWSGLIMAPSRKLDHVDAGLVTVVEHQPGNMGISPSMLRQVYVMPYKALNPGAIVDVYELQATEPGHERHLFYAIKGS